MGRLRLFVLLVLVAALVLISSVQTFLPHQTMMSNMMGGGFGEMTFLWPMMLTASAVVAMVAVAYVVAFPAIKYATPEQEETGPTPPKIPNAIDIVMRV